MEDKLHVRSKVSLAFKEAETSLKRSGLSHGTLFTVERQEKEFASDDTPQPVDQNIPNNEAQVTGPEIGSEQIESDVCQAGLTVGQ